MGLQFQRGLSGGDWELEERVTKKSCGAGRRSVYTVLIQAAKMEIPVGYLSWRDSKCALLIFNQTKDSSAVRQKMGVVA